MSDVPEEEKMPEELKKLNAIASDMKLDQKIRVQAINLLGNMQSREALLALLALAANEKLSNNDRDLALKRARDIIKTGR